MSLLDGKAAQDRDRLIVVHASVGGEHAIVAVAREGIQGDVGYDHQFGQLLLNSPHGPVEQIVILEAMRAPRVLQSGLDRRKNCDRENPSGKNFFTFVNKRVDGMPENAGHGGNFRALAFVVNEQRINQIAGKQMRLRNKPPDGI